MNRYKPNGTPLSDYERELLVILMEECGDLVVPNEIQKWMLDAGALEPLLDSIEKTILAAEEAARLNSSGERENP